MERPKAYVLDSGLDATAVCLACRGDQHESCTYGFEDLLAPGEVCCCAGQFAAPRHALTQEIAQGFGMLAVGVEGEPAPAPAPGTRKKPAPVEDGGELGGALEPQVPQLPARQLGDSGYIHPDAWNSTADIGTLKDPASTGRKRAADMFAIPQGYVCEWARKKNCGGGVHPIVGCVGYPAQDIHHGPDKSTLNNAKVTWGIGTTENVHLICSFCHNTWHARNNGTYPPYDRTKQQEQPWLPYSEDPWPDQVMVEISSEEAYAEDERRRKENAKNGRATGNGRVGRRADGSGILDDDEPDGEPDEG
jgi:hypothetical protein